MIKLGITGGIGAGKSIVCQIFMCLNIPVFNADYEAKKMLASNLVKDFYRNEFGPNVFSGNEIDKTKVAALIFNNEDALQKVNNFIHPLVFNKFSEWCLLHENSTYVIKEAAILFETNAYKLLDYTLLVKAPLETRIARVIERDKSSREFILLRINKQMDDDKKEKMADFVLKNDDESLLIPEVLKIHNKLIQKI